jgi:quinol-cytochrome oxidoreductase complex cytochrome b subunit
LPSIFQPTLAWLLWGDVSYWAASITHNGRAVVPVLGPPIRLT